MEQPIIQPIDKEVLKSELTPDKRLRMTNKSNNEIYVITAHNAPNVMQEIGRLREIAFREAGGGTGKEVDIDEFDTCERCYKQLIVWNPEAEEIIGGYRYLLGTDWEYDDKGQPILATSHMFHFSEKFIKDYAPQTVELGRSFVSLPYQSSRMGAKSLFALDNLWDGLGALTVIRPNIRYYFGKMTMYPSYIRKGRDMILYFLKKHFGFFQSEQDFYQRIADEMGIIRLSHTEEPLRYARHPLVYLVEAADDICYEVMDIEDAHKLKILSYEETERLLLNFFDEATQAKIRQRIDDEALQDTNEKIVYLRACVIGKLENECANAFVENEENILNGTFTGCLIDHIHPTQKEAYRRCAELSKVRIYRSRPVLDVELSGYKIMETLMKQMTEAVMHPERYYSQQLISRVSSQYDIQADNLETRIMAVIDYIAGMTDVYALDVYQKINGISLPIV